MCIVSIFITTHTFHQGLCRHQTHWRWTHQHKSIHLHRFKYVHQIQFMFWVGSSFWASPNYPPTLTTMQNQQTPAATVDTLLLPATSRATSEGDFENAQCHGHLKHKFLDCMEHIHSVCRGQPLVWTYSPTCIYNKNLLHWMHCRFCCIWGACEGVYRMRQSRVLDFPWDLTPRLTLTSLFAVYTKNFFWCYSVITLILYWYGCIQFFMQPYPYRMKVAKCQGGVTPIDSIVTAATVGQNFDRLFSAVWPWPR